MITLLIAASRHADVEAWQGYFKSWGSHTVEVNGGGQHMVLTDDPENIKAILATQFRDYGKGEDFHRDWEEFLGDSIFATDLDQWHQSRQLIRPQFIKDRVSDLHKFEKHCGILLPMLGGGGEVVDVKTLFFCFTLDVSTEFLLGKSVGSLTDSEVRRTRSRCPVTGWSLTL